MHVAFPFPRAFPPALSVLPTFECAEYFLELSSSFRSCTDRGSRNHKNQVQDTAAVQLTDGTPQPEPARCRLVVVQAAVVLATTAVRSTVERRRTAVRYGMTGTARARHIHYTFVYRITSRSGKVDFYTANPSAFQSRVCRCESQKPTTLRHDTDSPSPSPPSGSAAEPLPPAPPGRLEGGPDVDPRTTYFYLVRIAYIRYTVDRYCSQIRCTMR